MSESSSRMRQRAAHREEPRAQPATGVPLHAAAGQPTSTAARATALLSAAIGWTKRHKRVVQVAVLLLIAVFLASAVSKSWSRLTGYHWHIAWTTIAAAFALFVAQELSFALIWRTIVRRLGSNLNIISSERIYLGAEFVRYIPGNVWHVITRVLWAEREGVPRATGLASMVIELATKIASAALVFALSLFFWSDLHGLTGIVPQGALITIAVVGTPLLLLGLQPRLLARVLNMGLRALKREPVQLGLRYGDLLLITALWAASWLLVGAGFALLVGGMGGAAGNVTFVIVAAGIYALGWDIGFLSFVTPSGLGFREIAIAGLLVAAGITPLAVGIVVALLTRILTTSAELVSVGGVYAIPNARNWLRGFQRVR